MTALSSSSRVRALRISNPEHRAAAHGVGFEPDEVILEQSQEDVLEERAEMRHEPLSCLDQLLHGRRAEPDIAPCAAVVAVTFEP